MLFHLRLRRRNENKRQSQKYTGYLHITSAAEENGHGVLYCDTDIWAAVQRFVVLTGVAANR